MRDSDLHFPADPDFEDAGTENGTAEYGTMDNDNSPGPADAAETGPSTMS